MPDFPLSMPPLNTGVLSNAGMESGVGQHQLLLGAGFTTATAWPANNQAYYYPVLVTEQITVYQLSMIVAVQAGNFDIGIYDEVGNRLVSAGSTAVGPAGVQVFNVTDTTLNPGVYFLAGVCSTTVTATFMAGSIGAVFQRTHGVQQQATALPLPATATFTAYTAAGFVPVLAAHYINATV